MDRYGIIFLVVGMTMIFSGLWVFEAYTGPVYEEKEVLSSFCIHTGSYNYTAPVTEPNPLYPVKTELEMGKPAYFFAISPTLDVAFSYRLEAASFEDLSIERKTMLVATGRGSAGGEQKIFWQKKFPLAYEDPIYIKERETLVHEFSLDVPEVQAMVKGVQDQLKYSEGATIEVVTYVSYDGKINGERVKGVEEFPLPLSISSAYYQMPEELEFSKDTNTYKKLKVKKDPSLLAIKTPLSLFLFSMVLVGILLPCRKMSKVDPEYIERLEKERKHEPFKEFVSKGTLPRDAESLMKVEVASLQDLVDAAVDMNARIVHDSGVAAYFIIHNGVLYIFHDELKEKEEEEN